MFDKYNYDGDGNNHTDYHLLITHYMLSPLHTPLLLTTFPDRWNHPHFTGNEKGSVNLSNFPTILRGCFEHQEE